LGNPIGGSFDDGDGTSIDGTLNDLTFIEGTLLVGDTNPLFDFDTDDDFKDHVGAAYDFGLEATVRPTAVTAE
jgi:hypothetical protein